MLKEQSSQFWLKSNGFGKTDRGWISLNYTSTNIGNSSVGGTSGQTKKLARAKAFIYVIQI